MSIEQVMKSKIGKEFTLPSGRKARVLDAFSCYDGDFFIILFLDDNTTLQINAYSKEILSSDL